MVRRPNRDLDAVGERKPEVFAQPAGQIAIQMFEVSDMSIPFRPGAGFVICSGDSGTLGLTFHSG